VGDYSLATLPGYGGGMTDDAPAPAAEPRRYESPDGRRWEVGPDGNHFQIGGRDHGLDDGGPAHNQPGMPPVGDHRPTA
jgi:hypothetical protein